MDDPFSMVAMVIRRISVLICSGGNTSMKEYSIIFVPTFTEHAK